jgi:hypothetical protein
MTFHEIWNDSVWSKVIGALIVIATQGIYGIVGKLSRWPKRFWQPALRRTHAYCSDQATTGAIFPLKYYVEMINDARKCIAVRVSEYKPNSVTLQKFVPNTLQIELGGTWLPTPHAVDVVAVLPNQRCRAWIGVDATKFTKANVDTLAGKIGTLTITADSKKIQFPL